MGFYRVINILKIFKRKSFSRIHLNLHNKLIAGRQSLEKAKDQNRKTVCVHVRRGDMLKRNLYNIIGAEELLFAMNWMEKRHKGVVFHVASDDLHWSRKYLNKKNVFLSNFTSAEEDFVLMQSCDHMIMTVGTFGWWAAWMTSQRGGDVMFHRTPCKPQSPASVDFDKGSYFLPKWWSYQNQSVIQFRDLIHTRKN